MSLRTATVVSSLALAGALVGACEPVLPEPPKQCDPAGVVAGERGCLSDEICVDFKCLPRPKCEVDEDCPSCAFQCVLPAQICELREGFGQECQEPDAPCAATEFCALGLCRPRAPLGECSESLECAVGQRCDRVHFFCIPDADCRLAGDTCAFPEVACDPTETCDALSGRCVLGCQNQCEPGSDECGGEILCDGSCRCVQCINNDDCGPGLVCNSRSGQCQSENLCFSDADCVSPLICDPRTAICQVAPPACLDDFDCAIAEVCDVATGRCVEPEGPCIDDRFEEADTPANAEELDLLSGETVLVDSLTLCPDDDDVYLLALEEGDQLTATIQSGNASNEQLVGSARATLWLYDETAENALRFTQAPPFGSGRITYVAQTSGIVYLRLNALSGQTPYDLLLERDSGTPCQADFFEGPTGNDDPATATPAVPDGVALSGTVCPGDQDLFELTVGAGEALSATLAFDATASDLDVAFVDATGAVLAQDAGADAPEFLRRRFAFARTVYVRVRGFGTDTGSYTLTVNHEPPFVCTPDAAEPDDDVASATLVPLNLSLAAESRTICLEDEDLLLAPLEDFERVIVQTIYDDTDLELTIDVLDATTLDVTASSPPATGGAAVSYDATGDEDVLVRVRGEGGAIGAYTLVVTKENQLACTPDSSEPNNTVVAASALPAPSDLLTICESDQDFFVIEGIADKKLIIDASFRQAEGDIDLMLLGLDGVQILEVADGTSDGEHLEALLPLDGNYGLRVFSLTSGARAPYSLATELVSP
jgi:hypothetical protein